MNETIIHNFNNVVLNTDTCYMLGDFALCPSTQIKVFRNRLNCENIILIKGNHDRHSATFYKRIGFQEVYKRLEITINDIKCILTHKPPEIIDPEVLHLVGHVHNNWVMKFNIINVGVDVWQFKPHTLEEMLYNTTFL